MPTKKTISKKSSRKTPTTKLKDEIKILKSELSSCPVKLNPGEVFISDIADFFVGCKNSSTLKIKELQAEGKNPTIASEFVKGNKDKILNLKKFH